jgi:hypothetical protein
VVAHAKATGIFKTHVLIKGITLSKGNNETFDSFASHVVCGILICSVWKLVVAIMGGIERWFISNQAMLLHLLMIATLLIVASAILFGIISYVGWSIQHARDTDSALASIKVQIEKVGSRLDSHRHYLNGVQPSFDDLWQRVNGLDEFTQFAEHRAMLEKARQAEAEVTGRRDDEEQEDEDTNDRDEE